MDKMEKFSVNLRQKILITMKQKIVTVSYLHAWVPQDIQELVSGIINKTISKAGTGVKIIGNNWSETVPF